MNLTNSSHSIAWNEIMNLCSIVEELKLEEVNSPTVKYLLKCTTFRLLKHVWPQEKQNVIMRITETFGGK